MKKVLLTLIMVVTVAFCANAQSDGFLRDSNFANNNREGEDVNQIGLPKSHNSITDEAAPLGSGLIILTALGAGYAAARRKQTN